MNSSMIVSNIDSTPRKMFVNDETDVKMMYLLPVADMDNGDAIMGDRHRCSNNYHKFNILLKTRGE